MTATLKSYSNTNLISHGRGEGTYTSNMAILLTHAVVGVMF